MKNIKNISDISGVGGDYEKQCQKMLQYGYEWLENNKSKKDKLEAHEYEGVFGIIVMDSKEAEELSKHVLDSIHNDCSAAMHRAVMGHLFYISKCGIDNWIKDVKRGQIGK